MPTSSPTIASTSVSVCLPRPRILHLPEAHRRRLRLRRHPPARRLRRNSLNPQATAGVCKWRRSAEARGIVSALGSRARGGGAVAGAAARFRRHLTGVSARRARVRARAARPPPPRAHPRTPSFTRSQDERWLSASTASRSRCAATAVRQRPVELPLPPAHAKLMRPTRWRTTTGPGAPPRTRGVEGAQPHPTVPQARLHVENGAPNYDKTATLEDGSCEGPAPRRATKTTTRRPTRPSTRCASRAAPSRRPEGGAVERRTRATDPNFNPAATVDDGGAAAAAAAAARRGRSERCRAVPPCAAGADAPLVWTQSAPMLRAEFAKEARASRRASPPRAGGALSPVRAPFPHALPVPHRWATSSACPRSACSP